MRKVTPSNAHTLPKLFSGIGHYTYSIAAVMFLIPNLASCDFYGVFEISGLCEMPKYPKGILKAFPKGISVNNFL